MEREAEIAEKQRELAAMKEEHANVSISFLELLPHRAKQQQ